MSSTAARVPRPASPRSRHRETSSYGCHIVSSELMMSLPQHLAPSRRCHPPGCPRASSSRAVRAARDEPVSPASESCVRRSGTAPGPRSTSWCRRSSRACRPGARASSSGSRAQSRSLTVPLPAGEARATSRRLAAQCVATASSPPGHGGGEVGDGAVPTARTPGPRCRRREPAGPVPKQPGRPRPSPRRGCPSGRDGGPACRGPARRRGSPRWRLPR